MPKLTQQEQLCRGLIALGMTELKKTAKYRRFHDPKTQWDFFVGSAGALRYSRSCKATMTLVAGPRYREQVFKAGDPTVLDPSQLGF